MHRLTTAADELWRIVAKEGLDPRGELVAFSSSSDVADADKKGGITFVELERHPSELLLGFTAWEAWWAVGLLTTGWAAPMETDPTNPYAAQERPSAHPDAVRMRMLVMVDRDGTTASKVECSDGRVIDEPGEGYLLDLLRRTVGVPTPPPTSSTSELITAMWLMSIEGAAADERGAHGRRLSWNRVARLHPALDLLAKSGERRMSQPVHLVPAARAMHNVMTWERVREQCIEHAWLAPLIEPDEARWMDEGVLSRYLLTEIPPLATLVDGARRLLRADVAARLDAALDELAANPSAAA